jgi:hypothetical protein
MEAAVSGEVGECRNESANGFVIDTGMIVAQVPKAVSTD